MVSSRYGICLELFYHLMLLACMFDALCKVTFTVSVRLQADYTWFV